MCWVLIKEVLVCLFSMTQLALLSEVSHIPNFFDPRQSDLVVLHFLERHKKCGVEENITDIFFIFFFPALGSGQWIKIMSHLYDKSLLPQCYGMAMQFELYFMVKELKEFSPLPPALFWETMRR